MKREQAAWPLPVPVGVAEDENHDAGHGAAAGVASHFAAIVNGAISIGAGLIAHRRIIFGASLPAELPIFWQ